MSIVYPLIKSRHIKGATCGHFLKPSKTHAVIAYPGELVFREVISSTNGLGESLSLPCPSQLQGIYKLPRQDGRLDWLLLVFAEGSRSRGHVSLHIVGFEGDSLVEKSVFKVEYGPRFTGSGSIHCDVRFGRIAVLTDDHTVVLFSYENPDSPRLIQRSETRFYHSTTWVSEKRLAVWTYGPGFNSTMLIIDITGEKGTGRLKVHPPFKLPVARPSGYFTYSGVDNTVLCIDKKTESAFLLSFIDGRYPSGAKCPLKLKDVEIPLPFATSERDVFYLGRHSETSSFIFVGKYDAYRVELNTTTTLPTISDSDCHSYRNPALGDRMLPGTGISSELSMPNDLVGFLDDSRVLIFWTGNLVELSPSEHTREGKSKIMLESSITPRYTRQFGRFRNQGSSASYYLLGVSDAPVQYQSEEIHGPFLEVCRLAKEAAFIELGEIPHTGSVQRVWARGSFVVLSTEYESRFMKINMKECSLMSIDKPGWQLHEPTLAMNSHVQVTTTAIHGSTTHIKHEGVYLAAANDSVVVVVRSKTSQTGVLADIYNFTRKESNDCSIVLVETKEFSQTVLAVALDEESDRMAFCFNTHILFNDKTYPLPGPAQSLVILNGDLIAGLMDGRAVFLPGDGSNESSRSLKVGTTPVTVFCPLEEGTVILSCSSNTVVYQPILSTYTGLRKPALRSIARLPGENLVIMVEGRGQSIKIGNIAIAGDDANDTRLTRIKLCSLPEQYSVVVDHVKNTLWYYSGGKSVHYYSIEPGDKFNLAKQIHEVPMELKGFDLIFNQMVGLSLSTHSVETVDAVLIVVESAKGEFSLQAIFPEHNFTSRIVHQDLSLSPIRGSYERMSGSGLIFVDIVSLPCIEKGVGRAHLRLWHSVFEIKVSLESVKITRTFEGERFVTNGPMAGSSTAVLTLHQIRPPFSFEENINDEHLDGTIVYTRRDSEFFELSKEESVPKPMVLSGSNHFLDILEPKRSDCSLLGNLIATARVRMTDDTYTIIPALPTPSSIDTIKKDTSGLLYTKKCLDPSAYLVGQVQGDIHAWIEVPDDKLLQDIQSLESAIKSNIRQSLNSFYDSDTSEGIVDGSLLRRMFLYCSRSTRGEFYQQAQISFETGEAIRQVFISIYG